MPVVRMTQWHAVLVAAAQESRTATLLGLLEAVVARLGHGLQVRAIEEQPDVSAVRSLVVDDVAPYASASVMLALTERVLGELLFAQLLPAP